LKKHLVHTMARYTGADGSKRTNGEKEKPMRDYPVRYSLTRLGELAAHPAAFGILALYAAAWFLFSPRTFSWGAIATLATWMITLFITRTEHRYTQDDTDCRKEADAALPGTNQWLGNCSSMNAVGWF
jgi:hypothetical protein